MARQRRTQAEHVIYALKQHGPMSRVELKAVLGQRVPSAESLTPIMVSLVDQGLVTSTEKKIPTGDGDVVRRVMYSVPDGRSS
jgi:hypothetical protein